MIEFLSYRSASVTSQDNGGFTILIVVQAGRALPPGGLTAGQVKHEGCRLFRPGKIFTPRLLSHQLIELYEQAQQADSAWFLGFVPGPDHIMMTARITLTTPVGQSTVPTLYRRIVLRRLASTAVAL